MIQAELQPRTEVAAGEGVNTCRQTEAVCRRKSRRDLLTDRLGMGEKGRSQGVSVGDVRAGAAIR